MMLDTLPSLHPEQDEYPAGLSLTALNPRLLPTLDDTEVGVLTALFSGLEGKSERNLLRSAYYDGKRALAAVSQVVPPRYNSLGIVLGWSAKAVDVLHRRTTLEGFTAADSGVDDQLEQFFAHNRQAFHDATLSSLIHGTAYLITSEGGLGEPPILLHARSALDAFGAWNHRTNQLDSFLSITGRGSSGQVTEFSFYTPGRVRVFRTDQSGWGLVDDIRHRWGIPVVPVPYRPRLNRPFGQSRINRAVMGLQDQATRALIRLEGHLDVFSFPEFWLLGADMSAFRDSSGNLPPQWQTMLGRIKAVPDDEDLQNPRADVKQFNAADPSPHLAGLNAIAKLFARETSLPDTALAITDTGNPTSAEAYDASQYELIAEAEGACDTWGVTIAQVGTLAARILSGDTGISGVRPRWRDPRFQSRAQLADAGVKQLSAIDWLKETRVGLELLGLNEQQISEALTERARLKTGLFDRPDRYTTSG